MEVLIVILFFIIYIIVLIGVVALTVFISRLVTTYVWKKALTEPLEKMIAVQKEQTEALREIKAEISSLKTEKPEN